MKTPNIGTRWDLAAIYPKNAFQDVENEMDSLLSQVSGFRKKYHGATASLDAGELLMALSELEEIQQSLAKSRSYAHLLFSSDSENPINKKLHQKSLEFESSVTQELLFFEIELMLLAEEKFSEIVADEKLKAYRHYLYTVRRHRAHMLQESDERLLKQKSLTGVEAFSHLFDELCSSFAYKIKIEGKEHEMTGDELLGLLHHHDSVLREHAFSLFLNRYKENGIVFTTIFNTIALDHGQEIARRNYANIMEPTHLANEVPRESVENLMTITEDNYHIARDYFLLKARLLATKKMKNSDLYAPVSAASKEYSFWDAKEMVLKAYSDFCPELRGVIEEFFSKNKIDAYPRIGKAGGAYCMGISPSITPYILLNFTGNIRDVATLAHEVGHGIHYVLAQKQTMLNYHPPLPLAETASVFGEMLLTRMLLDHESDQNTRVSLLCAKIEDIIATTFRQNVLTRFEERLHNERKSGLLSNSDICDIWWEENAKLYGGSVEMIEPYRWGWSYISHFIHSRFYCYSYTFAELLVLALFQRYTSIGQAFVPAFISILENGGALSPHEAVSTVGIDLNDPVFWQSGYDVLNDLIAELKGLV